ncbi:MAG: response regulator [Deltaproteobacteria bacterium]|nr:response regulator [Deltaproteobacteria bacterium]
MRPGWMGFDRMVVEGITWLLLGGSLAVWVMAMSIPDAGPLGVVASLPPPLLVGTLLLIRAGWSRLARYLLAGAMAFTFAGRVVALGGPDPLSAGAFLLFVVALASFFGGRAALAGFGLSFAIVVTSWALDQASLLPPPAPLDPHLSDVVGLVQLLGVGALMYLTMVQMEHLLAQANEGERHHREQLGALQRSKELLERVGELLPDVVAVGSPGAPRLTYVSAALSRLCGLGDDADPRDLSIWERVVEPSQRAALLGGLRSGLLEPQLMSFQCPGGERVMEVRSAEPSDGGLVVFQFTDVTELLSEERRLAAQARELGRVRKLGLLGHFAGGLVHDLNNIHTVIAASASVAAQALTGQAREDLREVQAAVARAANITQELRAFSHGDASSAGVVDLSATVARITPLLVRLVGSQARLALHVLDHGLGARVAAAQVERVLSNLVVNALRAVGEGGSIAIGLRLEGEEVCLSVRDDGVGMDAETAARCFEPFFTRAKGGTGLGLATVFGLAHQWGGRVALDTAPGEGTTVSLFLPRVALGEAVASERARAVAWEARGTTALLVEDEPAVRRVLARVMRGLGLVVAEAGDLAEALARAAERPPELLVCDVMLPGHNGLELAQELLERHPGTRVLLITGYSPEELTADALDRFPLLAKPFTGDELQRAVAEVMSGAAGAPPSVLSGS